MSTFLDAGYFNGTIQKMVETSKGYFINGQYYNKKDLTPLPLVQFPIVGNITNLSLSKNVNRRATANFNNNKCLIRDDKNPDISYIFVNNNDKSNINILKVLESEKETKVLLNKTCSVGANMFCHDFIGQDENYIYFNMSYGDTTYSYNYLSCIRKNDLAFNYHKLTASNYEGQIKTLISGENIFIINNYNDYCYNNLYIYNKKDNTNNNDISRVNYEFQDSSKYNFTANDSADGNIKMSKILKDEKGYYVYSITDNDKTRDNLIKKTYIDISKYNKDNIHILDTEIIIPDTSIINNNLFNLLTNNRVNNIECFVKEVDGTQYLNIAYYSIQGLTCKSSSGQSNEGIFSFLIGSETKEVDVPNPEKNESNKDDSSISETIKKEKKFTTAKLVHFEPFEHCMGTITNNDDSFLIALNQDNVIYYNWNNTNMGYAKNTTLPITADCISIDEYENIFILESNTGKIFQNSPSIPNEIIVKFEKNNYKYEGEEINTFLEFELKNFEGTNLEKNVILKLTGNAVFTSNNAKEIKEMSSADGKKNIAVTITGEGNIFARGEYDG